MWRRVFWEEGESCTKALGLERVWHTQKTEIRAVWLGQSKSRGVAARQGVGDQIWQRCEGELRI